MDHSFWAILANGEVVADSGLEANARLIAAAPRMLAVVRRAADMILCEQNAKEARAILRDVEGESHG